MKKFLNVLILLIFNHIFPMDRFGGSSAQAMVRPQQNDYLNSADDFLTFVIERFTLENKDYSPFLQELLNVFNYASSYGQVSKRNVNDWIDNIMSHGQQQEGVVELTPEQLRPVDLVCKDAKSPYFVNKSTLSRLQSKGDVFHPAVRCKFTVLDLPKSLQYWVTSGKFTFQEWRDKLQEGDSLTLDDFNLTGLDDLILSQVGNDLDEEAILAKAIALSLEDPNSSADNPLGGGAAASDNQPGGEGVTYIYDIIFRNDYD
jgi:hypothetical protein